MALTAFQSSVLRLLADNRRSNAESYVAGGLALNYKLGHVTSTYSTIPKRHCSEAGKATARRLRQMALP